MEVPSEGFAFYLSLNFLLMLASQLKGILTGFTQWCHLVDFIQWLFRQCAMNAYKSSVPTSRIERKANCFSRFEGYSTYVQYVVRKQKSKYKRREKKYKRELLHGIHQKMSTAVPKSKIID